MTIVTLTEFFGWASIINIAVLMFTSIMVVLCRKPVLKIHTKMFGLNEQDLGRAYFQYLAQFKIATIVFSMAPYIALKIIA
ncbi:MAG: DUF6868 family protein [Nitrospinales bacterium]